MPPAVVNYETIESALVGYDPTPIYEGKFLVEEKGYGLIDESLSCRIFEILGELENKVSERLDKQYNLGHDLQSSLFEALQNLYQHENSGLEFRFYLNNAATKMLCTFELSQQMQEPTKQKEFENLLSECYNVLQKNNERFGYWFCSQDETVPLGIFLIMRAKEVIRIGTLVKDKAYFYFEAKVDSLAPVPVN